MNAQPNKTNTMNLSEQLDAYTWQKRVLLIVSPSAGDKNFVEQRSILEDESKGLLERDLEVITKIDGDISQTDKNFLNNTFAIDTKQFNAILIGKDGGAKLKSREPIPSEKLFGTIDAMPMRKQEMKRNKE